MSTDCNETTLTKTDRLAAVASGAFCAAIDALLIRDLSFAQANEDGNQTLKKFEEMVQQLRETGERVVGESRLPVLKGYLEKLFPAFKDELAEALGDQTWKRLQKFAKHPSIMGLFFSVLKQFIGKEGDSVNCPNHSMEEGVYLGAVGWLVHVVGDNVGINAEAGNEKAGKVLPGPMLSLVKQISSMPKVQDFFAETDSNTRGAVSDYITDLLHGVMLVPTEENGVYRKEKFDFKTELGILKQTITNKQHIPVILNEVIVASFYTVTRIFDEVNNGDCKGVSDFSGSVIKQCLPWKNKEMISMRRISSITFSTIDIVGAGVKAAYNNRGHGDDKTRFAVSFLQGVNYWGLGDVLLATKAEAINEAVANTYQKFSGIISAKKQEIYDSVPDLDEWMGTITTGGKTAQSLTAIGTTGEFPFAAVAIMVYKEIKNSLDDYQAAREMRIQMEQLCAERIEAIRENQEIIDRTVSDYLVGYYELFDEAFAKMDHAIETNNSDEFIEGNNMIQEKLNYDSQFNNQDEFDALVDSEEDFVL